MLIEVEEISGAEHTRELQRPVDLPRRKNDTTRLPFVLVKIMSKLDADRSLVYEASPLVVLPERKTSARCALSKWCTRSQPYTSPVLFDDDVLILEDNDGTRSWNRRKKASPKAKSPKTTKYLFENDSENELDLKPDLSSLRSSISNVGTQVGDVGKGKSRSDASTCIDKSPAQEALDAYFSEHPFLDLAGSCGGVVSFMEND
ncbi:hypothetical protein Y032_0077g1092 [Ancylostoma ceylanicum]|uniref:Uncharacterized protein n=2 Tax=Ancylostoma ceylanicum TaxID=53326 RepID=A0A016TTY3_9BILA|nr:hypothetical protein Y032_0077g1092 [Ancylostoma ceylanicum]